MSLSFSFSLTRAHKLTSLALHSLKVLEEGIVRLDMRAMDFANPQKFRMAVRAMHDAISRCPAAEWPGLWRSIIVSGPCAVHEDFLEAVETDVCFLAEYSWFSSP